MKSIEQQMKIDKETLILVNLFLKTGYSDIELSSKTGISSSTVGRRLVNEENITTVFNKEENEIKGIKNNSDLTYGEYIFNLVRKKRKENLLNGRKKGGEMSIEKHGFIKDLDGKYVNITKIDLNKMFVNPEKQYKFLCLMILTYRVKPKTIKSLLDIPAKEIEKNLFLYNKEYNEALEYLIKKDQTDQELALHNFKQSYVYLTIALKKNDKNKIHELVGLLNDDNIMARVKDVRKDLTVMKELIKYQIKYALSVSQMSKLTKMSEKDYISNVKLYLLNDKKMQEDYLILLQDLTTRRR